MIERASKVRNFFDGSLTPPYDPSKSKAEQPSAWHPYFWTDPESGKKTLLASPTTIARSDTATPEEGKQLMREIWEYAATRDDLVYAHHWAPGDLVVWHNCLTQHARLPFNGAEPRTLSAWGEKLVVGGTLIGDPDPEGDDCGEAPVVRMTGRNVGDLLNAKGVSWGWFQEIGRAHV